MSRIRIVGGTITKTIGGDHNIYSEGNIVYNSGQEKQVMQELSMEIRKMHL